MPHNEQSLDPTKKQDDLLEQIRHWKDESEQLRSKFDHRWARNTRLVKGVFNDYGKHGNENHISSVRKRRKLFFRKTWAIQWRIVSSFFSVFLRDDDTFHIEGRDTLFDHHKAKILDIMVKYRYQRMLRRDTLFVKLVWGLMDIVQYGSGFGVLDWVKKGKNKGPRYTAYPPEQIFPDMTATTKSDMEYITIESYLTKRQLEERDYDNIKDAQPESVPNNPVRSARHVNDVDPLQNITEKSYPTPGSFDDGDQKDRVAQRYILWETFYREDGKIKFIATNKGKIRFTEPIDSPFGDLYPVIMGSCLLESHKLLAEGFPQPLEGFQESINSHINQRKDNIALELNGRTLVSRFGNVDLFSLLNSRTGGATMVDDVNNSVVDRPINNVTQTAYAESSSDDLSMQEMSGVTSTKSGLDKSTKATVAQINLSEGNAKIDFYTAIVGETFMKDFFSILANHIQLFETDKNVFRVANDNFRIKTGILDAPEVFDLDFDADIIMKVGLGAVGKQVEVNQTLLAMDRAVMANQSTIGLISTGIVPPQGVKLFDLTKFMVEELLPKIGKKNVNEFFVDIPAEAIQQGLQQGQNPALAGSVAPGRGAEGNQNQFLEIPQ